jgi:hypothetical protein
MTLLDTREVTATRSGGVVGSSIPRGDQRAKLDGSALFAADLPAEGALHLKLLRSAATSRTPGWCPSTSTVRWPFPAWWPS